MPRLFSYASGPLEHVHLSLPFVTTKNKEVNATAVLWPSQVGTLTYVWWYGNNTEVGQPSTQDPLAPQLKLAEEIKEVKATMELRSLGVVLASGTAGS